MICPSKRTKPVEILLSGYHIGMREFALWYLDDAGKNGAYVNEMFRAWKIRQTSSERPEKGTYASFRRIIWSLKDEGLIQPIPERRIRPERLSSGTGYNRVFYRLVKSA